MRELQLMSLVAVILLAAKVSTEKTNNREWVVGYEKVDDACKPVGGLTIPGVLPFPYATLDDCEADKKATNYNSKLKSWHGYVLEEDDCIKVSARARFNPFQLDKAACEAEKQKMEKALVASGDSRIQKRDVDLVVAGTWVQTLIVAASLSVPQVALLAPVVGFLWPTGPDEPSVWEQSRAQVHKLINQKMNDAYAKDLEQYLGDLKGQMENYNGLGDSSSNKLPTLIALDISMGSRSNKFMNEDDPISTLTYFLPYVTARQTVKLELIRLSSDDGTREEYGRQFIQIVDKYIDVLRPLVEGDFYKWRITDGITKSFGNDRKNYLPTFPSPTLTSITVFCTLKDTITGVTKTKETTLQNHRRTYTYKREQAAKECTALHTNFKNAVKAEVDPYINTLHQALKSWEIMSFNMKNGQLLNGDAQLPTLQSDLISTFIQKVELGRELPDKYFSLLYKATRDGMTPSAFHQKCDNKGPTLLIAKDVSGDVYGAYTTKAFTGAGSADIGTYVDSTGFPFKMCADDTCLPWVHKHAYIFMWDKSGDGPTLANNKLKITFFDSAAQRSNGVFLSDGYCVSDAIEGCGANVKWQDMEVFAVGDTPNLVEVALKKTTFQSPTHPGGDSWRAVDGNTGTDFAKGSCTHTALNSNPWWRVDLGQVYEIHSVDVTNLFGGAARRLRGFNIRVSSVWPPVYTECAYHADAVASGATEKIVCSPGPVKGRYVVIAILNRQEYLSLCEVKVWAKVPGDNKRELQSQLTDGDRLEELLFDLV